MVKAMKEASADLLKDAARVIALDPRTSLRIEGCVTLKRNGILLAPPVLTSLAKQSRGRSRTILEAFGHAEPMTWDYRAGALSHAPKTAIWTAILLRE
jgi:hypothetical protein